MGGWREGGRDVGRKRKWKDTTHMNTEEGSVRVESEKTKE